MIVDEGQDFREDWWVIVEESLNDRENGILYVFFDDHQVTFPVGSGLKYNKIPLSQINLSKNCRNAGEIYEIVRQLYPEAPEVSELLAGEGVVREYIYFFDDDDYVYDQIKNALIEAEIYSNQLHRLKDIIVISAQNSPLNNHKINGWIFNTPELMKSPPKGRLEWREAILYYLQSHSLLEDHLSKSPKPTDDDIRAVTKWCRRYGKYKNLPPLKWHMDYYGTLRLKWDSPIPIPSEAKLAFFGHSGWAESLPVPYKSYRLTPIEDFPYYPDYYNIRLVDIPSFKGLEANGIVFANYGYLRLNDYVLKSNLYMALSRARHLLHIVSPFSIKDKVVELSEI